MNNNTVRTVPLSDIFEFSIIINDDFEDNYKLIRREGFFLLLTIRSASGVEWATFRRENPTSEPMLRIFTGR